MLKSTSRRPQIPGSTWLIFLLAALPVGVLVFLALISRVYGFWFLSRWPRMVLFGIGALLCAVIISLLLRSAWLRIKTVPRIGKLFWLAAALAVGIIIRILAGAQPPMIPMLYVLDIATPGTVASETGASAAGGQKAGPVVFIELRDYTGRPVLPVDMGMEGDWQRSSEGWVAQSDRTARLHYTFYAPARGKLQVLFGEQPGSGPVQLALNGQSQQVDLNGPARGQRLVEIPFQKASRWELPVFIADLVLMGLVLPLALFVLPFYALDAARWGSPRLRSAAGWLSSGIDYQKVFVVAFLAVCLLPLLDYKGGFTNLEQFFLQGNSFWKVYSQVRQNVFGDRFIGGTLIGEDGWLILANDHSLEDYQNTISFSEEELYQIQQRIDSTNRYLRQQGITFLVVITPNKNTIYPDELPAQIQVIGEQSRLDQILEYQQLHGEAHILDLRPALQEARKQHLVYHKTDTHWNDYGAYAGYVEIMETLQQSRPEFPGLKPHTLDEYTYLLGDNNAGDMGRRWAQGNPQEQIVSLQPLFERQVNRVESFEDRNRIILSYQYNGAGGNLPRAVIFHDSFMDWLAPFLTDNFQRAVYYRALDDENTLNVPLIESEKPDIVIYECNERLLRRLLSLPMLDTQEK